MFYFFNIVIVLYNLLLYAIFRGGVYDYLRLSKMSKTNIRKKRKGFWNYWLYLTVNREKPLGALFYLNILFFFTSIVFSGFTLCLGFIEVLGPLVTALAILLCAVQIPSMFLASIYSDKEEYGRCFVLLAKRKANRSYHSSLLTLFPWVVTVVFIWCSLVV